MRYPACEKLEIVQLVEHSHLPVRRTLVKLGIPRATFYRWYDLFRTGGPDALYQVSESLTPEADSRIGIYLIHHGKQLLGEFAMSTPVPLRSDFDTIGLRMLARRSRDPDQTRRLLALAEIYDGGSRPDAARIGGVGVQIVRDWVVRFNAKGPDGLLTGKAPGAPSILGERQRQALRQVVEDGPIPALHGVVRWRLIDLAQWLFEEFRVSISKPTLSRELRHMGFRKLSARPRHHAQDEEARSSRSGRVACLGEASRPGQHHALAVAAEIARAQSGREHLAIHARQLALEPRLRILRRHSRPLLLRLEQAHRHALENHLHRNKRVGLSVVISETWY